MNKHHLKIWPEHYNNIKAGSKTFEIRKNDRAFQKGDKVRLYEYCPEEKQYKQSERLDFAIGDVYPIDNERVVFSLLPILEMKDEV